MVKHLALLVALSMCSAACTKRTPELERKPPREEKPAAESKPREPMQTRVTRAPAEPPPIDPAAVPVEEDFRDDAARKLTKKSDLRLELDRIERDVAAAK
jgi:hypothetical protein